MGRSKPKHARKKKNTTVTSSRWSPELVLSIAAFIISTIIFLHQCVTPLDSIYVATALKTFKSGAYLKNKMVTTALNRTTDKIGQPVMTEKEAKAATAAEAEAAAAEARRKAVAAIPAGPFPLPQLSGTNGTSVIVPTSAQAGLSWSMSLIKGMLPTVPAHWAAEVTRAATALTEALPSTPSIFRARQKGEWMGCVRPHHLVCKGVYRAAKAANVLTMLSLGCADDVDWLPHILRKLREELRPIRLYCAITNTTSATTIHNLNSTFHSVGLVDIVKVDIPHGQLGVTKVDMLVAYRALTAGTLIDAMRLLRGLKQSGVATLLVTETYPDTDNAKQNGRTRERVNVAAAPFLFPAPAFEYANENENESADDMEIVTIRIAELFEQRLTPEMKDLVDPRKRTVLQ